jgi:hypothetical protein
MLRRRFLYCYLWATKKYSFGALRRGSSIGIFHRRAHANERISKKGQRPSSALSARRLQSLQMNPRRIFLVLTVVCLFVAYGAVFAERRAIGEVDRKFLNDIVRQQGKDADTVSAAGRNIGTDRAIPLGHPAVLRAELIINSATVRRGELVVHSGVAKRRRPSITISRQNMQAGAESGRRLN